MKITLEMDQAEPYLPPDLERLIFEMAFDPDDVRGSTKLILVARRVRELIRPMIYCIFKYVDLCQIESEVPDFRDFQGLALREVGKFVKHVIVGEFGTAGPPYNSNETVEEYIQWWHRQCPNIENLACWFPLTVPGVTLSSIFQKDSKLRRLSICISSTVASQTKGPSRDLWVGLNSKYLTHLDLMRCSSEWPFEVLLTYPNLTHFSAYRPQGWTKSTIQKILDICPLLHVFIVYIYPLGDFGDPGDLRVVLCANDVITDSDWFEGAKGRYDSWSFAERIVHARKHKYFIDGTNFWDAVESPFDWKGQLKPEGWKWYSSPPIISA